MNKIFKYEKNIEICKILRYVQNTEKYKKP